jgi:hypothetical protein
MCWAAKSLIAVCVGYLPSPGETVTVNRSCVYRFTAEERDSAKLCAAENGVAWRINWRR